MGVSRDKIEVINYGVGDDYHPEGAAGGCELLRQRYGLPRER